ncbi:MAG: AtpZ/AtpI family protein [Dehalococcoidia bacterium]|nr:AtpZ/AtpI family protein [Dehalococcoidia bacterium]
MVLNSPAFALVGVGFSLGVWIGGGAYLGHWLDGKFGTAPVLTLVLLLLGLAIGLYDAYRRLKALVASNDKNGNR